MEKTRPFDQAQGEDQESRRKGHCVLFETKSVAGVRQRQLCGKAR